MRDPEQQLDDFVSEFQAAFARLQICVETACAAEAAWPGRVAAAIRAAFSFAAAHPDDADLLTNRALAAGREGFERYDRMLEHFAEGLRAGRGERPHGRDLPPITDRAMVGGLASLIAQRLGDRATVVQLPALAPEAIQFVLTPYLGAESARELAAGRRS
ncbi:MAG: hypothetical protein WDZ46_06835 [Solirubrobacterales bacterium]